MKIHLIQADHGGSGFYRVTEPARVVTALGIQTEISNKLNVDADRMPDGSFDVRYVHLPDVDLLVVPRPLSQGVNAAVRQASKQGIWICVDLDDDFHNVHPDNVAAMSTDPKLSPMHNKHWLMDTLQYADWVTVSTPALLKYAPIVDGKRRGSVVGNYMPERILELKHANPWAASSIRVGWTGTVSTHPQDISRARGLMDLSPGLMFNVVGDDTNVASQLGIPPARCQLAHPWTETVEQYWAAVNDAIDVGIAPLETSKFNKAKCLDYDTKVISRRGVVHIGDLERGDHVWRDGWRRVVGVEHSAPQDGIRITTVRGDVLILTVNHRMSVEGDWVEASDIRPGDLIDTSEERQADDLPYVRLPWPPDGRVTDEKLSGFFARTTSGPMVAIDETWGELLGLFAGDGSVEAAGAVNIHCDGQDLDLCDHIEALFGRIGLRVRRWTDPRSARRVTLSVNSAHLVRFLESLGVARTRSKGKKSRVVAVPDVIWESPLHVMQAFLRGFHEADGSVGNRVESSTIYASFASDVRRLLIACGYPAQQVARVQGDRSRWAGNPYWKITMSARVSRRFCREVGFLSARKQSTAKMLVDKQVGFANLTDDEHAEVLLVESALVRPVDIQVEGEEFVVSGLVSHNSWLKCIEYMALGIPFVASPLPEYRLAAQQSGAGEIASGQTGWAKKLQQVIQNREYYAERGLLWSRHNTLEIHAMDWLSAWETAAGA